ncbi:hypothetical protein BTA51_05985 [Hahella sp. CCB-MM4]|nr:hypothetical protein BTA51_05985 [Hahella sp. CCB-MM4]
MAKNPPLSGDASELVLLTIRQLLDESHPERKHSLKVRLDSQLDRDLGLDSLSRAELIQRLEQVFAISLPEKALSEAETPQDLLRMVREALQSPYQPEGRYTARKSGAYAMSEVVDDVPDMADTLIEVLTWHRERHAARPHLYLYGEGNEPEIMTYEDLYSGGQCVAGGLQHADIQPGDTVAIMLPTGKDYLFSFIGILMAGAVPVPIYPPANLFQLEDHLRRHTKILSNAQTRILITLPEVGRLAGLMKAQVESLDLIMSPKELKEGEFKPYAMPVSKDDIAFLQYTSGSTGQPKGVILTHNDLLANIRAMGEAARVDSTDTFVSWLPLYHDMGLIGAWLNSLYHAMPLVLMSPLAFLAHPARWLWAISRHRGTISGGPNFSFELCLNKIPDQDLEGLDLSSIRILFNGAEAVSPKTLELFAAKFGPFGLRPDALAPVYGLAEVGVDLTIPPLGRLPVIDHIQRAAFTSRGVAVPATENDAHQLSFVTCGHPLPGYQVRIVDDHGKELPDRHQGHLEFMGPSATRGYYRNPEATKQLYQGEWLCSGDLAYVAQGDLYLTGRVKDIVIRGGRNIYPHEVEEAVGNLNGIRKGCVAVFGSSHQQSGTEKLVIVAETREQESDALVSLREAIIRIASDLIGMPPDDVLLVPPHSVLKTSSGKIRRSGMRELYEHDQLGGKPKPVVWQILRMAMSAWRPAIQRLNRRIRKDSYAFYVKCLFWGLAPFVWTMIALIRHPHRARAFGHRMAGIFLRMAGWRLSVEGLENLPVDKPCVVVANHSSYLDGLVVAAALPIQFGFVAKGELKRQFFPRVFLNRLETEFVERFDKQKGIADARKTIRTLQRGLTLVYFPEGTFTRMPGLLPFHMGAFVAAAEAGVCVVPLVIRGTRSIMRAEDFYPHKGDIQVCLYPPINPEGSDWNAASKLRVDARRMIFKHLGEPDLGNERPLV